MIRTFFRFGDAVSEAGANAFPGLGRIACSGDGGVSLPDVAVRFLVASPSAEAMLCDAPTPLIRHAVAMKSAALATKFRYGFKHDTN